MAVRSVQNPGENPGGGLPSALPMPCMCWHSWMSDPFATDFREQSRRMMAQGEAMIAAGKALQAVAEREAKEPNS